MKLLCSKVLVLLIIVGISGCSQSQENSKNEYYKPWQELGELFHDVQMEGIFPDSKTFVDYTPKRTPDEILADYELRLWMKTSTRLSNLKLSRLTLRSQ